MSLDQQSRPPVSLTQKRHTPSHNETPHSGALETTNALRSSLKHNHLFESAARLSRETSFPCTQTALIVSYASTPSSGDFFNSTRFAILPGSIVPSCASSLNSCALLIVAALNICANDNPALRNCCISRYPFSPGRFPYVGPDGVSVPNKKFASRRARYPTAKRSRRSGPASYICRIAASGVSPSTSSFLNPCPSGLPNHDSKSAGTTLRIAGVFK